jgi:hypothetical protein
MLALSSTKLQALIIETRKQGRKQQKPPNVKKRKDEEKMKGESLQFFRPAAFTFLLSQSA